MKRNLTRVALAAMFVALPAFALRAQGEGQPEGASQAARAVFALPATGPAQDVAKVTTALKQVRGVSSVTGLTPQSRMVLVTYAPAQVSVQQIAQAIGDSLSTPGRANPVSLVVRVADLGNAGTQEKAITALRKVPGVAGAAALDAAAGTLAVQFVPMTAAEKAGGLSGTTMEQITKALGDAGVTISIDVTPAAPSQR
jgi:copper chaperone CopZ